MGEHHGGPPEREFVGFAGETAPTRRRRGCPAGETIDIAGECVERFGKRVKKLNERGEHCNGGRYTCKKYSLQSVIESEKQKKKKCDGFWRESLDLLCRDNFSKDPSYFH